MKITVASGKGSIGKTTVATSLALSLAIDAANGDVRLFLDCDVEAPNAHLFLDPIFEHREDVNIFIPEVDETACTYCGNCADVCPWHAIAVVGQKVLVFPQLCHGCGSCTLACPEGAIREIPNPIGATEAGSAREGIWFAQGVLNVGEPMMVTIVQVRKALEQVMDPELNRTVVELGMVRDIAVDNNHVRLTLALTTLACPL